jgi:undecaprenyl-diphosphatase
MNELINFIILGMIQGLTEFFPVSSSGHLVLFQDILSINNEGASAEIIAHFGTLFSILLFYKASFFSSKNESDFFHINTLKFLVISTIPAVICGLIFDFEQFFNYQFVQYSLLANGCLIIVMSLLKNSFSLKLDLKSALLLGLFQSIAILPGISRSGMVISSALMMGLDKEKSIQYCFFMVIPVIVLSIFYEILFAQGFEAISFINALGLFISSFMFGYFSLFFLVQFLKSLISGGLVFIVFW